MINEFILKYRHHPINIRPKRIVYKSGDLVKCVNAIGHDWRFNLKIHQIYEVVDCDYGAISLKNQNQEFYYDAHRFLPCSEKEKAFIGIPQNDFMKKFHGFAKEFHEEFVALSVIFFIGFLSEAARIFGG